MKRPLTAHEAAQLMGLLIANTNGWDDLSVDSWSRQLCNLGDGEAAARAVELLVNSWTGTSRPPWGKLMEAYSPKPDEGRFAALPSHRETMSAATYLRRLTERAATDDRAAAELRDWQRTVATSNVWALVIPGIEDAVHPLRSETA